MRDSLTVLPEYDTSIRQADMSQKLLRLSDLYQVFIPSAMSMEIYAKLYMATVIALQKKESKLMTVQQNENHSCMRRGNAYRGIIGGADSFSIIGISGIGKTSSIERAIQLISDGRILENDMPFARVIPILQIQCPFDASPKSTLLEILRCVDEQLGTNYYVSGRRSGVTTDTLIGTVAQVASNHIALLVIDEVQNLVRSRNGSSLISMLTQLINCSGISIALVGIPEVSRLFEQEMQIARRTLGLCYGALAYDDFFVSLTKKMLEYIYVKSAVEVTDGLLLWLYEHSGGIISALVSLIHDAQELSIMNGSEVLNVETLEQAYRLRMSMLHSHIEPLREKRPQTKARKKEPLVIAEVNENAVIDPGNSLSSLAQRAKDVGMDIVSLLKEYIKIEEVPL